MHRVSSDTFHLSHMGRRIRRAVQKDASTADRYANEVHKQHQDVTDRDKACANESPEVLTLTAFSLIVGPARASRITVHVPTYPPSSHLIQTPASLHTVHFVEQAPLDDI